MFLYMLPPLQVLGKLSDLRSMCGGFISSCSALLDDMKLTHYRGCFPSFTCFSFFAVTQNEHRFFISFSRPTFSSSHCSTNRAASTSASSKGLIASSPLSKFDQHRLCPSLMTGAGCTACATGARKGHTCACSIYLSFGLLYQFFSTFAAFLATAQ
jgi:hypothetical protein